MFKSRCTVPMMMVWVVSKVLLNFGSSNLKVQFRPRNKNRRKHCLASTAMAFKPFFSRTTSLYRSSEAENLIFVASPPEHSAHGTRCLLLADGEEAEEKKTGKMPSLTSNCYLSTCTKDTTAFTSKTTKRMAQEP